jgi:hypothetical protein
VRAGEGCLDVRAPCGFEASVGAGAFSSAGMCSVASGSKLARALLTRRRVAPSSRQKTSASLVYVLPHVGQRFMI